MKKKVPSFVLLLSTFSFAQVGIGTTSPNASTILELSSTSKGFLLPRMSTEQRNAISSPAEGLTFYNTNLGCLETYNGVRWINFNTAISTDSYNPTTGQIWMDRNLDATQVATSSTDFRAYGSLFQWGRAADGHQLITWASASAGSAVNGTTSINDLSVLALARWSMPQKIHPGPLDLNPKPPPPARGRLLIP
jgi:hypothetical protein